MKTTYGSSEAGGKRKPANRLSSNNTLDSGMARLIFPFTLHAVSKTGEVHDTRNVEDTAALANALSDLLKLSGSDTESLVEQILEGDEVGVTDFTVYGRQS